MGADAFNTRLAARLAELRTEHTWSLEELASRSGVSRSTLSRLERMEISPTATLLNRLCAVYGRTVSQLFAEVETAPAHVLRAGEQLVWRDEESGFSRRSVSPPHVGLRGELIEATLMPGADVAYSGPPVAGLERHVWVLEGAVEITVDSQVHSLDTGDSLRSHLWGPSRFRCLGDSPTRYVLAIIMP